MSTQNQSKVVIFQPSQKHFSDVEQPSHDGFEPNPNSCSSQFKPEPTTKNAHLNGKSKHQIMFSKNHGNSTTSNVSANHSQMSFPNPLNQTHPQKKHRSIPNSSSNVTAQDKNEIQQDPNCLQNHSIVQSCHSLNNYRSAYFLKSYSEENPSERQSTYLGSAALRQPPDSYSKYFGKNQSYFPSFSSQHQNPYQINEDNSLSHFIPSLNELERFENPVRLNFKNNNYNQKHKKLFTPQNQAKINQQTVQTTLQHFKKYFKGIEWEKLVQIMLGLLNQNNNKTDKLIKFLESYNGRRKVKKSLKVFQILGVLDLQKVMENLEEHQISLNKKQLKQDKLKFLLKRLTYPLNTQC